MVERPLTLPFERGAARRAACAALPATGNTAECREQTFGLSHSCGAPPDRSPDAQTTQWFAPSSGSRRIIQAPGGFYPLRTFSTAARYASRSTWGAERNRERRAPSGRSSAEAILLVPRCEIAGALRLAGRVPLEPDGESSCQPLGRTQPRELAGGATRLGEKAELVATSWWAFGSAPDCQVGMRWPESPPRVQQARTAPPPGPSGRRR